MAPKAAAKKPGKGTPAAEPQPEVVAPVRLSRWVDVGEELYQQLLARPESPQDWEDFSKTAHVGSDSLTCDHRDLVALEQCFTFLRFCSDRRLQFAQMLFVMRTVQSLLQTLETDPTQTSTSFAVETLTSQVVLPVIPRMLYMMSSWMSLD